MELEEGLILHGHVSLTGGDDGPLATWIVVEPHGHMHIHSIDDPLETHCWPAHSAQLGLESGTLTVVGKDPSHPAVLLQREKERAGIVDAHLGLRRDNVERMIGLLEMAVAGHQPYAPYAAGEILGLMRRAFHTDSFRELVEDHVRGLIAPSAANAV